MSTTTNCDHQVSLAVNELCHSARVPGGDSCVKRGLTLTINGIKDLGNGACAYMHYVDGRKEELHKRKQNLILSQGTSPADVRGHVRGANQ